MASRANDRDGAAGLPDSGWIWLLVLGLLTIACGVLMLFAPGLTTIAVTVLVGWLLLILGIAGIVMGVRSRRASGRGWDIFMGLLSIAAGLFTLFFPLAGALSLTLAVTVWLAVRGVVWIVAAFQSRPGGERVLIAITGVIDLILAVILFLGFPFPAIQFVGIAVGISLIIGGSSTLVTADRVRKATA